MLVTEWPRRGGKDSTFWRWGGGGGLLTTTNSVPSQPPPPHRPNFSLTITPVSPPIHKPSIQRQSHASRRFQRWYRDLGQEY